MPKKARLILFDEVGEPVMEGSWQFSRETGAAIFCLVVFPDDIISITQCMANRILENSKLCTPPAVVPADALKVTVEFRRFTEGIG